MGEYTSRSVKNGSESWYEQVEGLNRHLQWVNLQNLQTANTLPQLHHHHRSPDKLASTLHHNLCSIPYRNSRHIIHLYYRRRRSQNDVTRCSVLLTQYQACNCSSLMMIPRIKHSHCYVGPFFPETAHCRLHSYFRLRGRSKCSCFNVQVMTAF